MKHTLLGAALLATAFAGAAQAQPKLKCLPDGAGHWNKYVTQDVGHAGAPQNCPLVSKKGG